MFQKALLPLDIHETETEIVSMANYINQIGIKYLRLLHVVSPGWGNRKQIMDKLNNLGVLLHSFGYGITIDVREGYTPGEICEAATENDIGFIFLPWRRKSKVYRTLLGSTAKEVVRLTDQPVLVYKSFPENGKEENIYRILYPTDLKGAAARAVPYVKALGKQASAVVLLHAGQRAADPVSEEKRQKAINKQMGELKNIFSPYFSIIESNSSIGIPYRNILKQVDDKLIDLIVMGRFNKIPIHTIMGSTSVRVVDQARCSLMLIP